MEYPSSFNTVTEESKILFKEKASKFISIVKPIHSIHQFDEWINELRKLHPQANHVCHAFRVGLNGEDWRCSDDGEPSGSAGPPILGQLDSFKVTFTGAAVVRYFGGTKLGVGGLKQAYKAATQMALEQAEILKKEVLHHYEVKVDYDHLAGLKALLRSHNLITLKENYEATCTFIVGHPASEKKIDTSNFLAPLQNGSMKFLKTGS